MRCGHALAGAQVAPGRVADFHPRFFSGGARACTIGRRDPSRGCLTRCMVRPRGARGFRRSGRCGLASMYPAFDWSVVLRAHHGYQRASVLITGQASTDHLGHQVSRAPGRPNLHLLFILSQTLAGKRATRECYTTCWPRRCDCELARSMRCVRACWRARRQARCGAAASWPPRSNA